MALHGQKYQKVRNHKYIVILPSLADRLNGITNENTVFAFYANLRSITHEEGHIAYRTVK